MIVTVPFDIGVGIVAGAATALVLKTRDRTPTAAELAGTLAQDRLIPVRVERAPVDARGSVPWFVSTADRGDVFVKTLGSDQRAADLLFRVYRMIRLRRAGDRQPFSSLRRAVEHEALLSLAALDRGMRTPRLVTVYEVGSDGMLLAYERISGQSLDGLAPGELTNELLAEVWSLVAQLRTAAIAHRDLRLANVFIADDGVPWSIDFGFAELAADDALLARDVAELLASTSTVVGVGRAVSVALEVMGTDAIADALPWIQPLALSSATASQIGRSENFAKLRSAVAAAVGIDDVDFEKIERVKPATLVMMGTIALSLYVLIPQLAQAAGLIDELSGAHLGWAALAVVGSIATYLGAATGMLGAVPVRLEFGPILFAQLASSFTNRITPAKIGGMATNVRYLQKKNLPVPMAVSAIGLNTLAGTIVHISLLAATAFAASRSDEISLPTPDVRIVAAIVGALIVLSGFADGAPCGQEAGDQEPAAGPQGRGLLSRGDSEDALEDGRPLRRFCACDGQLHLRHAGFSRGVRSRRAHRHCSAGLPRGSRGVDGGTHARRLGSHRGRFGCRLHRRRRSRVDGVRSSASVSPGHLLAPDSSRLACPHHIAAAWRSVRSVRFDARRSDRD